MYARNGGRTFSRSFPRVAAVCLAALGMASVVCVAGASAETLAGRVTLAERGEPLGDLTSAIAYFVPEGGVKSPPAPITVDIQTLKRRFSPRTVAVTVGSTVRFPNGDPVKHNVFSVSPGNRFDLGLYGSGPGHSQRFTRAGVVRVFCNVHRQMAASVLVLDTPWFAPVAADGRFELKGLPAGAGTVHVWHPRATEWTLDVQLPDADPVTATLETSLPAVPQHLNKYGQPYRPDSEDGDYR